MFAPPNSSLVVTPKRPMSPSLDQSWLGKSLDWSIDCAKGAISLAAKLLICSRSKSVFSS
ncbi:hypothetical protein AKJ18_22395 [Vibrio xuii]|nr:hypothetical protein AKJ18_22395 [Vibrio xuii]